MGNMPWNVMSCDGSCFLCLFIYSCITWVSCFVLMVYIVQEGPFFFRHSRNCSKLSSGIKVQKWNGQQTLGSISQDRRKSGIRCFNIAAIRTLALSVPVQFWSHGCWYIGLLAFPGWGQGSTGHTDNGVSRMERMVLTVATRRIN